ARRRTAPLDVHVGVAGPDSAFKTQVVDALSSQKVFDVHVADEAPELDKLKDSDRDFVMVFGEQPAGATSAPVTLYYDETMGPNAQIGISALNQILMGVAGSDSQVAITTQPIEALNISYIDFFVPGILAMALMNSGIIGLSTTFVTYREKGILRRIKVTPFSLTQFISARIVTALIIAVLQSVILLASGKILFGMTIRGNPLLILLTIIIGGLAFLSIGFAISGIARNTETAASYANLITFPMLFLSGVFFPIDSLPAWLQGITRLLPLRYLVDALREPIMRGKGISDSWISLLVLIGIAIVSMAIAVRFFKWDARPT
ncbi:MAG TPA: ABC transporter permease, partial [Thermomicrobiales bacterium]|nr:ABC transporter permease [Thermomicrobiales bacterium]